MPGFGTPHPGKLSLGRTVAWQIAFPPQHAPNRDGTRLRLSRSNVMVRREHPPPDIAHMSSAEIAAVVREALRDASCGSFDLVEVDVQGRRTRLHGNVPDEPARCRALAIVADELGLEVVDDMRGAECLWKQGEEEPKHGIEGPSSDDAEPSAHRNFKSR